MPMRLATVALAAVAVHASQESCAGGRCAHDSDGDEVGLLSLRTASSFGPLPPSPGPAPPKLCEPCKEGKNCIDSAKKYVETWNKLSKKSKDRKLPHCVSHKLFGSSYFDGCGAKKLYPESSQLAWIVSKVDLEQWLYMQYRFGVDEPEKVTASVGVIVGFGPPALDDALKNLCLGIFELPATACDAATDGLIPYTPTWSWWFSFMATQNINFDLPVQKDIILAYSQMGHGGKSNVLDVFQELTGCKAEYAEDGSLEKKLGDGHHAGCRDGPFNVFNALNPKERQAGSACVKVFLDGQGKKTWSMNNPGDVRMMLWMCFDVNPFNTGVGLGWNSYPNPLVCKKPAEQSNDDHYTGKEYVIENVELSKLVNLHNITLKDAGADSNQNIADKGFETC